MHKTVIIDTNVILRDYTYPFELFDTEIILPQIVIQEIDSKKTKEGSVGYNARAFCRKLKKLIKEQGSEIQLNNNSTLAILPFSKDLESRMDKHGLEIGKPDHIIIAVAHQLTETQPNVTLMTGDVAMWVTATALDIAVDDCEVSKASQDLYTGVKTLHLDDDSMINNLYARDKILLSEDEFPGLYPNQILVLKSQYSQHSSVLVVFKSYETPLKLIPNKAKMDFSGIRPLNKEQSFAFELFDSKLPCVTLAGRAGTGKTIVTMAYALDLYDTHEIDRIIILKPNIPVGKDLGFLPGTIEEKMGPWTESFFDSLDIIYDCPAQESKDGIPLPKPYAYLTETGILEFKPLTFIRGRSIQKTLIILDEAQNTTIHEIKSLLTRVGEGSKIIILGDVEQIDVPYLDKQNNGLTYLIEKGKTSPILAHITFIKAHRSAIADWASINL